MNNVLHLQVVKTHTQNHEPSIYIHLHFYYSYCQHKRSENGV